MKILKTVFLKKVSIRSLVLLAIAALVVGFCISFYIEPERATLRKQFAGIADCEVVFCNYEIVEIRQEKGTSTNTRCFAKIKNIQSGRTFMMGITEDLFRRLRAGRIFHPSDFLYKPSSVEPLGPFEL